MAEPVTLARPYAKATFQTALADGDLLKWEGMLSVLGGVTSHAKVQSALRDPSLTAEKQASILLDLCSAELNDKGKNFVSLLAKYRRLSLLPEIAAQFKDLKAKQEKLVAVSISSAFEMEDAVSRRLGEALSAKWGCQVELKTEVDKSLLGGVIIRAGDAVIDASVRGRVLKLAETLGV